MSVDLGRDISCRDSILTGRFVTYNQLLGEAIYRRLTTPRGMLRGGEDEANYGLDLSELIGAVNVTGTASALQGRIKSEIVKDERVLTATVTVVTVTSGPSTTLSITVVATSSNGPFQLQLLASAVTVQLLGITP